MRVESVSVGTQPLQNSDYNNRQAADDKAVEQVNQLKEVKEPTKSQVETVVEKLNDFFEPVTTNLKFQLHEELNEYYVTVINPKTNEVIKEIPSKKILDMYAAMADYMGFLIDKKI